jgi:hypothetical protein
MSGGRLSMAIGALDYVSAVEHAVGDADRLLDVGCGNNSPIGRFERSVPHAIGIDVHAPWIEESRKKGIHDAYVQMNALEIAGTFGSAAFDVVLACDVLEHLPGDEAAELLAQMEQVASQRVVVLTPNGFLEQGETWGNPHQVHRSGWTAAEFRERGYDVRGLNGLKALRGERGQVRLRPAKLGGLISIASQPFVWRRAEAAFHLLAVKRTPDRSRRSGG